MESKKASSPSQSPQKGTPQTNRQKRQGASRRKSTNIRQILYMAMDEEEENYINLDRNTEPNDSGNKQMHGVLSELRFNAHQRRSNMGGRKVGSKNKGRRGGGSGSTGSGTSRISSGGCSTWSRIRSGGGGGGGSLMTIHCVGGSLQEQQRWPQPSWPMSLPFTLHNANLTGTVLQNEPLDLTVNSVDRRNSIDQRSGSGAPQSGSRFMSPTLPWLSPSPVSHTPMDLTISSSTPPRQAHPANPSPEFNNEEAERRSPKSSTSKANSNIGGQQRQQHWGRYRKRTRGEDGGLVAREQSSGAEGGGNDEQQESPPVKPKQRRYRIEKPYGCNYCKARFTLRSNLERHGKKQHGGVWVPSPTNKELKLQRALEAQQRALEAQQQAQSPAEPQPGCSRALFSNQGVPQQQQDPPDHFQLMMLLREKVGNAQQLDSVGNVDEDDDEDDDKDYDEDDE